MASLSIARIQMSLCDFTVKVDGVEYTITEVQCHDSCCDNYSYVIQGGGDARRVTTSMSREQCLSGSLDPELRQAACNIIRDEIIAQIRQET